jgi:hypothetical protein
VIVGSIVRLAVAVAQLLIDCGPSHAEELADAGLELVGFLHQRTFQFHFHTHGCPA